MTQAIDRVLACSTIVGVEKKFPIEWIDFINMFLY